MARFPLQRHELQRNGTENLGVERGW
jgi:hypothetical protein